MMGRVSISTPVHDKSLPSCELQMAVRCMTAFGLIRKGGEADFNVSISWGESGESDLSGTSAVTVDRILYK